MPVARSRLPYPFDSDQIHDHRADDAQADKPDCRVEAGQHGAGATGGRYVGEGVPGKGLAAEYGEDANYR